MLAEEVTRSLYEFFVVYIHAVAYVSEVYPANSFSLKQQYGLATYECNHPGVRLWAENAAKAIMKLIYSIQDEDKSATISIVVLEDSAPTERFGITVAHYELQSTLSQELQSVHASDVSEKFRSCFSRLYTSVPRAESGSSIGKNRSLTVLFEGDLALPEIPSNWLNSDPVPSDKARPRIYPIRSIEIGEKDNQILVLNTFRQQAI